MSKDKKKDKLDNNMENISKKIESILQKRVLDITDKYKGKTRKGGYSVYLGYPQEMIEDLTKTIEGERERVIGEVEKVNRVEVIDHTKNVEDGGGRVYTKWEDELDVKLDIQDEGRTLKIFINKLKRK